MEVHRLARPSRFERLTPSLGGKCSIQLSYGRNAVILPLKPLKNRRTRKALPKQRFFCQMVGTAGLEPATSWSRTKRTTNCAMSRCEQ
jgi:hypothetical protein